MRLRLVPPAWPGPLLCPPPPTGPARSSLLLGLHQPLLHKAAVQLLDVGVDTLGVRHRQPHHIVHLQQLGAVGQFPEGQSQS